MSAGEKLEHNHAMSNLFLANFGLEKCCIKLLMFFVIFGGFGYIYTFVILFEFYRVFIGRSHVSSTFKMQMYLRLFETSMSKHFCENC